MKTLIYSLLFILLGLNSLAQSPEGFNYQAVIRDASNLLVTNQSVGIEISIHQSTATGAVVYSETFSETTTSYGLVNIQIGTGTSTDDFSSIDWSAGPYFIETSVDLTGGNSFNSMGTSQLMSVPYALHAKSAEMVDDADADSTNELQNLSLMNDDLMLSNSDSIIDLSVYMDNTDEQTLTLSGSDLSISGGNTITLPSSGVDGSGTVDYMTKFTAATTLGNSLMRDNGVSLAMGTAPDNSYGLYVIDNQLTADGSGQASIFARRTRDSRNDGTAYGYSSTNNAISGYNYWGDDYSFGTSGFSWNDYTRTGGVLGAYQSGSYWGSLGYKSSASTTYGVYGSSGYASGGGALPTSEVIGIGGGFYGDLVGSTSQGSVIGQLNSGDLFAQYNKGNVYTYGKNVELVKVNELVTPVYAVSSVEATIYAKGTVQLENGTAYITFDSEYASLLGENPVVTATPNGECNGVYIASIDKNGFTVKELMGGSSNASISWISVGTRIDNDQMELATEIVSDPGFNRNIEQVLFSDGNIEGNAKGIWWDGSTLQFGQIPSHLTKVDRSKEVK